ncbi:MAG: DUF4388 domain-containing protein [Pyrinomonadaceae bacterium]|nr:DUF4388 domain-containing protein [Pyrinomonadaceae bacterium]
MPLTGHLSDLSLSELIEFFCNQRKSGRLKVLYPQGSGYFYLQAGSVVDAKIGQLRGIDAVYYALTLPNAKFEFSGSTEAAERTINQPWTQVVLEGLRRLDEGITPAEAFPVGYQSEKEKVEPETVEVVKTLKIKPQIHVPAFLTYIGKESLAKRKPLFAAAVVVAVLGTVAAVGVPAGWYNREKVSAAASQSVVSTPVPEPVQEPVVSSTPDASHAQNTASTSAAEDDAAMAAKRQRERDRARAREDRPATANGSSSPANGLTANAGPKRITVTVTYDESGRVTQASGGDASAIRIARQKRFPPGKAGSANVTIPIN